VNSFGRKLFWLDVWWRYTPALLPTDLSDGYQFHPVADYLSLSLRHDVIIIIIIIIISSSSYLVTDFQPPCGMTSLTNTGT
jgi:hypothetical protein